MAEAELRYTYRLRVRRAQASKLADVFDVCRYVWNKGLGEWSAEWREHHRSVGYGEADRRLTARRAELDWLRAVPSVPEQQVLRDLYRAIGAFFDPVNPASRPSFKKKGTHRSARWTKNGFSVVDGRLRVAVGGGRIGLRVVWSRPLPSIPRSVTIYEDRGGRYFASFVVRVEVPDERPDPTGRASGIDVGLSTFATLEDRADDVANPRYLRQAAKALARSQRALARKKRGSKGRAQARRRLARQTSAVARQRLDFHHKAARRLVATYDVLGVEDLRVKNMTRRGRPGHGRTKAGLNRAIADASWGQFVSVLEHQAKKAGAEVARFPAANTTQRCSRCGSKAKTRLELSDRVFRCDDCGLELDRDRNAARNLHPIRLGPGGGAEPPGEVPEGGDGEKPTVPAGILAA